MENNHRRNFWTGVSSGKKHMVSLILALAPVLLVTALWIQHSQFGIDLGVWESIDDHFALAAEGCYITSTQGEHITVYFTDPKTEPCQSVGLDEILAADIDLAQRSIDMAAFNLDLESVTNALIKAQERGLEIRLVLESDNANPDQTQELVNAGILVVEDKRSFVMHNKFVIIDGMVTWTGSWNFTENGTFRNNNHAIRMVSEKISDSYTQEFEEMFVDNLFGPISLDKSDFSKTKIGEGEVEIFFAPEDGVMAMLKDLVSDARQSIQFLAFSFTDDGLAEVMQERANQGVLVEGVFESRGTETEASEFSKMRGSNITVWRDGNPAIMHHKVIIIDKEIVVAGSYNFSRNADSQNDENLVVFYNERIAALFVNEFNRIVAQARP